MPAAGWAQIIFLVGLHELTVAKQDYTKVPGEIPTFLSFKPEDPDVRSRTRAPQWQASLLDTIRRESDLTGAGGARSVDAGRDAAGDTETGRSWPFQPGAVQPGAGITRNHTRRVADSILESPGPFDAVQWTHGPRLRGQKGRRYSDRRPVTRRPPARCVAQVFQSKQLKELKNGRLAMIAVLGELMAQQVSGLGTYEQLAVIVKDLPEFIANPTGILPF